MKSHARRIEKLAAAVNPSSDSGRTELWEESEEGIFHCELHPDLALTRDQVSERASRVPGRQIIAIYLHSPPAGVHVSLPANGR